MPLSQEQRQRILDAISSGRLPAIPPQKMYGGYVGSGRACSGCDQEMEIEYEAHYDNDRTYYLHLGCAALWEMVRHQHSESAVEDARTIRDKSRAIHEAAGRNAKEKWLRDQADVLAQESEVAALERLVDELREKARQAKRGPQTEK